MVRDINPDDPDVADAPANRGWEKIRRGEWEFLPITPFDVTTAEAAEHDIDSDALRELRREYVNEHGWPDEVDPDDYGFTTAENTE